MLLYIKDYFLKRIFHILLIVFCGLLMFNSIMTLADLKNYEVVIDYSENSKCYQIEEENEKKKISFERPSVKVKYKYADMPYKFTWVSGHIFEKNLSIENFTVEHKVYNGLTENYLIDTFTKTYKKFPYSDDVSPIIKEYETDTIRALIFNVVDYDIKFNARIYLPHIFVIAGSLFFIVPSVVMLFKIKKEE